MVRYLKDSIDNMRDIGGYKSGLKNRVKLERLIRSNLPINLSNNDISFLNKMGINAVIDLRSQEEIENRKSIFEENENFQVYHIGIDIGKDIPETEELVPKSYMDMLTLQEKMKKIFEILGNNEKVLYFCNAGKDRTGVITALILKLLDVSEDDIIEDYVATRTFMKTTLIKYANSNNKILNIITPKRIYMQEFLREFEKKYNNIEKYLKLIGVENNIIKNIKTKYIE